MSGQRDLAYAEGGIFSATSIPRIMESNNYFFDFGMP